MSRRVPRAPGGFDAAARCVAPGPARWLSGPDSLERLARLATAHGDRILAVGGPVSWDLAKDAVVAAFDRAGSALEVATYGRQVTEQDIERLCVSARGIDAVVGIGGGRALDAAKLVAHEVGAPAYTIPTSAATCAAWTALSNVYTDAGGWRYGVALGRAPEAVAVDYRLVRTAGPRLLASGVADAMAKWYESDSVVDMGSADAMTLAAVELAHHLHKQLVRHASGAVLDVARGLDTGAVRRVVDLNIALAGAVGGLGGPCCRSVAAHAVANGLTHAPGSRASFHGEKVAFGLIVQLVLLDRPLGEIEELVGFLGELGIPLTLDQLLGGASPDLGMAAAIALEPDSGIHRLDVPLDPITLERAMGEADSLARRHLQERRLERSLRPIV